MQPTEDLKVVTVTSSGSTEEAALKLEDKIKQHDIEGRAIIDEANINEVRKILDQEEIIPNTVGEFGLQPLGEAAEQGHIQFANLLIARGANVNFQDGEGNTALLLAAESGHLEMVNLLLDAGADMKVCGGSDAGTALHKAAREQNVAMVRLLLDRGADPNAEDMDGDTASYLQHFFSWQRPQELTAQILGLLKQAGATTEIMDKSISREDRH